MPSRAWLAVLASGASCLAAVLPASGPLQSQGFGAHIEGASVDTHGNVYATDFRGTADDTFSGNNENRNVVGVVLAATGEPSAAFSGPEGSSFNGMRWDPAGTTVYLADPGRGRVVKAEVDPNASSGFTLTDHCGADGSLEGTGAPNDLALARDGTIFLSGQDWATSTGGLWLCRPDGTLSKLESMNRTNGIALSPGDDYLYLTEAAGSPVPDDNLSHGQLIWRYSVGPGGVVSAKTEFHNFAEGRAEPEASHDSDGMRTDTEGKLWVTRNGLGKVAVLAPSGALAKEVELKETLYPTNLAFGGADGTTLFVVGRCGSSSWGTGNGCVEAVAAGSVGREWSMMHDLTRWGKDGPESLSGAPSPSGWHGLAGPLFCLAAALALLAGSS